MLAEAPAINRLHLATVHQVPEWHTEFATFKPFPVYAWVIHHPEGPILFDTGIGLDHPLVNTWYAPTMTPIDEALAAIGLATADITKIVLSHLHFDHCGQQSAFDAPVYVQAVEDRLAQTTTYTVPEWAAIGPERTRLLEGDTEVADGVGVILTPGHTPGHQSLVIDGGGQRVVLAGQCAFTTEEVQSGPARTANLHNPDWQERANMSLERLRALAPATIHLSHDERTITLV